MPELIIYSDPNLRAGEEPSELVTNADSVNQNIGAILDTPRKSKWFRPNIGSDIEAILFEPIDDITSDALKTAISTALENAGEFRVSFTNITVLPDIDNQQYFVNVEYFAPELDKQNQSYKFNLARGTR